MNKKKIVMLVIIFICIIIVSLTTVFALKIWSSTNNTELTFKVGEYDLGSMVCRNSNDITISNMGPIFDYNTDGEVINFKVLAKSDNEEKLNINLNISTISDGLKDASFKYVLLSSTDNKNFTEELKGNFLNSTSNSVIELVKEKVITTNTNYKLIMYIDGNMENPITMQNGTITGNIEMCKESKLELSSDNATLTIPVVNNAVSYNIYSNDTLLATTTDNNIELYNYYETPGTYSIKVKAVMSDNTEKQVGEDMNYTIEQLNGGNYIYMFYVGCSIANRCNIYETSFSDIINFTGNNFELDENITGIRICETEIIERYFGSDNLDMLLFSNQYISSYNNISLLEPNNCYEGPLEELYLEFSRYNGTYVKYDKEINDIVFNGCNMYGYEINFKAYFTAPGYIDSNPFIGTYMIYCLSSDTEVIVYDKKKKKRIKKKIKDVTYDDLILVWDFDNGCFTYAKPVWIKRKQIASSYNLIKFSDGSILKTVSDHRIFNKEKGKFTYTMSDDTPLGTTTFNSKGEYVKLISKEVINESVEFCNVITYYHMNLFANNILTSCRLSNLYEIKNMKYIKDNRKFNSKEELGLDDKWYYGLRLNEQDININKDNNSYRGETVNDYVSNLEDMDINNKR